MPALPIMHILSLFASNQSEGDIFPRWAILMLSPGEPFFFKRNIVISSNIKQIILID